MPNANGMKLVLDKERTWRLRWKDAAEVENRVGQLRGEPVKWLEFRTQINKWSAEEFGIVLWAGLRHEDPSLTLDDVMELADFSTQDQFMVAFSDLVASTLPERFKKKYAAELAAMEARVLESSTSWEPPASASD